MITLSENEKEYSLAFGIPPEKTYLKLPLRLYFTGVSDGSFLLKPDLFGLRCTNSKGLGKFKVIENSNDHAIVDCIMWYTISRVWYGYEIYTNGCILSIPKSGSTVWSTSQTNLTSMRLTLVLKDYEGPPFFYKGEESIILEHGL